MSLVQLAAASWVVLSAMQRGRRDRAVPPERRGTEVSYIVHVFNRDGASHEQQYLGPFRSYATAEAFAKKLDPRLRSTHEDGNIGATVLRVDKPLVRNVVEAGWFE